MAGPTFLITFVLLASQKIPIDGFKVEPVFEWKNIEYDYPSEQLRQQAIVTGEFILSNPRVLDVDVFNDNNTTNTIFVTTPRFRNGTPATLGTVTKHTYNENPIITPYPSWSWHQNSTSCPIDRIVSVFRIKIDECGRLWVLDTGSIQFRQVCQPQLLAFDLKTNQLVHRYEIPESYMQSNSLLVAPMTDVRDPTGNCSDTYVYIADARGFAIIVYDMQRQTSWKITDKTFYPYPDFGTFKIAGSQFELMDGVLAMALSNYEPGKDRVLYYHATSSGTENRVYTSLIRNQSVFVNNPQAAPQIFHTYPGRRRTQASPMGIDKNGIAYFGLASTTSINCWNTALPYREVTIRQLARNRETLQYTTGLKVIGDENNVQQLWFVNTRASTISNGLDLNVINYRVHRAKLGGVVTNALCFSPSLAKEVDVLFET